METLVLKVDKHRVYKLLAESRLQRKFPSLSIGRYYFLLVNIKMMFILILSILMLVAYHWVDHGSLMLDLIVMGDRIPTTWRKME